jgi:uncharacterized protein YraI
MRLRHFALAAGLLLASVSIAAANTVTNPLNLRSGPGTGYRVIATMPPGSHVDVLECGAGWCRVAWRGIEGFASASYLAPGGGAYVYAPGPYYDYGPPYYAYAPGPAVGFSFGFGGGGWGHGWHGGHSWHGGHGGYGGHGHHH